MARGFAKAFYHSKQWKKTRQAYADSKHNICERCLEHGFYEIGEIVHHKVHLTKENINDASISLNYDNLELLCRKCHAEEHPEIYGKQSSEEKRYRFDAFGNIIKV